MKSTHRSAGFTLTELMVTLVVVGILTAMAVPSFRNLIEKRRLIGAAELIYSQFTFARNESVKRSKPIYVTVSGDSHSWAIGITDRQGGCDTTKTDPTDSTACSIDFDNNATTADRILYVVNAADYPSVWVGAPTFGTIPTGCSSTDLGTNETCFDPVRGTARDGPIPIGTTRFRVNVVLNSIGRAIICSPPTTVSTKAIPDYRDCP